MYETFLRFFILVTFLTFLTFFLFSKTLFTFEKRWQSSERQADKRESLLAAWRSG